MQFSKVLTITSVALAVSACGSFNADSILPDKKVEYKREQQATNQLEIPPDLSQDTFSDRLTVADGASTTYSDYEQQKKTGKSIGTVTGTVLPENPDIQYKHEEGMTWLVVKADPATVWARIVEFWRQNGILLQSQDPNAGVMRTGWAENRADIRSDFITDAIRSMFDGVYAAGTKDQFRVRLERGQEPGTTEVYLTHFGMEQKFTRSVGGGDEEQQVWEYRPTDPELEAEMLAQIAVYLGAADDEARREIAKKNNRKVVRSRLLINDTSMALDIDRAFDEAWRVTGFALDRIGFAVEDRDRAAGIYYVRYNDPSAGSKDKGWLDSLKFWGDDEVQKAQQYRIKVVSGEDVSRVTILNDKGERLNSATARRILTLLNEEIR